MYSRTAVMPPSIRVVHLSVTLLLFTTFLGSQSQQCESCPHPISETTEGVSSTNLTCSFAGSLCSYHHGCVSGEAPAWGQRTGYLEVTGEGEDYSAFSALLSPAVHVTAASCLRFLFAQTLPSKLAVTTRGRCLFSARDLQQPQFAVGQADVESGNVSIEFRAQNLAKADTWVRLKDVTLEPGLCKKSEPILAPGGGSGTGSRQQAASIVLLLAAALCLAVT